MLPAIGDILYCTDLSTGSTAVFEQVCYLARETNANIHILHVVEPMPTDAMLALELSVRDMDTRYTVLQDRKNTATKRLEQVQDNFWSETHQEDIELRQQIKSVQVIEGYPAETILDLSKHLAVDMIVMGTHEKGILERFLGSVAKNVLERSAIPVLVVPLPLKNG